MSFRPPFGVPRGMTDFNDAATELLRQGTKNREDLIRAHFKDTPIALQVAERTGIMPWNITLYTAKDPLPSVEIEPGVIDAVLRYTERLAVVEHPRERRERFIDWDAKVISGESINRTTIAVPSNRSGEPLNWAPLTSAPWWGYDQEDAS